MLTLILFASYSLKFYNLNLKDLNRAVNPICLWTCLLFFRLFLKAGAKVQLIFYLASFFEIFFIFFLQSLIPILFLNVALFAGRKGKSFIWFRQTFFEKFFLFFYLILTSRLNLNFCMNFPVNAGAKVILFLKLTSFFEKKFSFFILVITPVIRFKISLN